MEPPTLHGDSPAVPSSPIRRALSIASSWEGIVLAVVPVGVPLLLGDRWFRSTMHRLEAGEPLGMLDASKGFPLGMGLRVVTGLLVAVAACLLPSLAAGKRGLSLAILHRRPFVPLSIGTLAVLAGVAAGQWEEGRPPEGGGTAMFAQGLPALLLSTLTVALPPLLAANLLAKDLGLPVPGFGGRAMAAAGLLGLAAIGVQWAVTHAILLATLLSASVTGADIMTVASAFVYAGSLLGGWCTVAGQAWLLLAVAPADGRGPSTPPIHA